MTSPTKRPSRFDFGDNHTHTNGDSQTATLKDLMDELTYEKTTNEDYSGGSVMSINQLDTVLRLLRFISGKPLKSVTEKHPLADIKTIKSLYLNTFKKGMHLIGLIEPPGADSEVAMNILTLPPTEESGKVLEAKRHIIFELEREIFKEEKEHIDALFNPQHTPHAYWLGTNEAIDEVLLTHLHIVEDASLLLEADAYLTAKTEEFMRTVTPAEKEKRLHISTYVYLRSLEFLHMLNFEITTNRTIPNDRIPGNMQVDLSELCKSIPPVHGVSIQGHTPFMSLADVPKFCIDNAKEIARLVKKVTTFKYRASDILEKQDAIRAKYALAAYLESIKLPSDENPNPIAVVHIVAAFCSVRHQRKMKSKPKTSRRYSSKLIPPQKQLDAFINRKGEQLEPMPPMAWFIYSERTLWYTHALLNQATVMRSHQSLQTAQAKLLSAIYTSLNLVLIPKLTALYQSHMVEAAQTFVALHGKENTRYDWIPSLGRD